MQSPLEWNLFYRERQQLATSLCIQVWRVWPENTSSIATNLHRSNWQGMKHWQKRCGTSATSWSTQQSKEFDLSRSSPGEIGSSGKYWYGCEDILPYSVIGEVLKYILVCICFCFARIFLHFNVKFMYLLSLEHYCMLQLIAFSMSLKFYGFIWFELYNLVVVYCSFGSYLLEAFFLLFIFSLRRIS